MSDARLEMFQAQLTRGTISTKKRSGSCRSTAGAARAQGATRLPQHEPTGKISAKVKDCQANEPKTRHDPDGQDAEDPRRWRRLECVKQEEKRGNSRDDQGGPRRGRCLASRQRSRSDA